MALIEGDLLGDAPDLTEDAARFIARANCLAQLETLTIDRFGYPWHGAMAAEAVARLRRPGSRKLSHDAARLLRVAWQTEVGGRFAGAFEEVALKRVAAMTMPVSAYYALFNINRALSVVAGRPISNHASLQADFAGRAPRLPLPWGATLDGDPEDPTACTLIPAGLVEPYGFNTLERAHPPEAYLWAALRMTRRWKYEAAREAWMRDKANRTGRGLPPKRLPAGKPAELRTGLRPTTLLDFVYELRRRAHYVTVDEYGAEISDLDIQRFYSGMTSILDSGMLVCEAIIAHAVGPEQLTAQADAWLSTTERVGSWATEPLATR